MQRGEMCPPFTQDSHDHEEERQDGEMAQPHVTPKEPFLPPPKGGGIKGNIKRY